MRVLTCLAYEHSISLVLLAALVCLLGSLVTIKLTGRALESRGMQGVHWTFLASVCAGCSIWSTHFIAMLGYRPGVPVHFEATLTIVSALIGTAGAAIGLGLAKLSETRTMALLGGGTIGLAISAMHYVGMFAYRPDGLVTWDPAYVGFSIASAVVLASLAIDRLRRKQEGGARQTLVATMLLVAGILLLHFVGVAAFQVAPVAGLGSDFDSGIFSTLAAAIAVAAVMIVGTGISTHLVEESSARTRKRLHQIAMQDMLTGIANRHSFVSLLATDCSQLNGLDSKPFALLMIDLDKFKAVNDTMGHPVGDLLLKSVAKRLQKLARPGDIIARLGGDEFAMIARGVEDPENARSLADRIVEALSRPYELDGHIAEIGASVGLTLAPTDSSDAEKLTQQADVALYQAKRDGRGRVCVFDPSLTAAMLERCALESELRHALENGTLEILYQPIYDARSRRCTGAEALLRWHSPTKGDVSPETFIPIAEELGLIGEIGAAVLKRACSVATGWPWPLAVSVNVSPSQIESGSFFQTVREALDESGLSPHRLEIEIIENSLLSDSEVVRETLEALHDIGVQITLDDFGKGYSSLSYLRRFPIDRIKIDRSFISQLLLDTGSASIIRAICQLGESLGLEVTAEGIENVAQFSFVAMHGTTHVQGFLLSEPLTEAMVSKVFHAESAKSENVPFFEVKSFPKARISKAS